MNTSIERPSAVIYQFPVRRRAETGARTGVEMKPVYEVAVIDGWYHADAIRESDPVRHS
ncbi:MULTISPECIES: DUF2735 domain-containing protein [unclassified Aureimonas]|uniref:DUF2735 domain-containing protein n=1 Tax=unclassified Aureimonas TaxID=2615206 RepID=UPI000A728BD4|nr:MULTISPECIES: DUF2735 domain-containing protein [unclassified Aureimonas]